MQNRCKWLVIKKKVSTKNIVGIRGGKESYKGRTKETLTTLSWVDGKFRSSKTCFLSHRCSLRNSVFRAWWRIKHGLCDWWRNRFHHDFKSVLTYFKFALAVQNPQAGFWAIWTGKTSVEKQNVSLRQRHTDSVCVCVCFCSPLNILCVCVWFKLRYWASLFFPFSPSRYVTSRRSARVPAHGTFRAAYVQHVLYVAAALRTQSVGFICISNMPVDMHL